MIIGITGNSGSGKSTICSILQKKWGYQIIDADKIAKQLARKGTEYLKQIEKTFGSDILTREGELDRKKLAGIIYYQEEKRNMLNQLTYEYVGKEICAILKKIDQEENVAMDIPLLFESGLDCFCDITIGMIATKEVKIERICKRDGISKGEAIARIETQKTDDFLKKYCNYIIENTTKDETKLIEKLKEIGI